MRRSPLRSPPRVRGKELHVGVGLCSIWITPAYAGKRGFARLDQDSFQDHPRVCGEKYPVMDDAFIDMGSPPRVRGKGLRLCAVLRAGGITPAYAGKRGDSL